MYKSFSVGQKLIANPNAFIPEENTTGWTTLEIVPGEVAKKENIIHLTNVGPENLNIPVNSIGDMRVIDKIKDNIIATVLVNNDESEEDLD